RDPGGGGEQLHDFDLELDDGTIIAFEVTRYTDSERERTMSHVERLDWRFPQLSHDWHLGMTQVFDAPRLHSQIGSLLKEVEATGVESTLIGYGHRPPEGLPEPLAERLHTLGIR